MDLPPGRGAKEILAHRGKYLLAELYSTSLDEIHLKSPALNF